MGQIGQLDFAKRRVLRLLFNPGPLRQNADLANATGASVI
jgi:hypothetical protein